MIKYQQKNQVKYNTIILILITIQLSHSTVTDYLVNFPLSGNSKDLKTKNYGYINGDITPCQDRYGREDMAMEFGGSSSYIQLDASNFYFLDIDAQQLSISVFVKVSSLSQQLFDNSFEHEGAEYGINFSINTYGNLYLAHGNGVNRCTNSYQDCYTVSTDQVPLNKWVHLAVVKNGQNVKFYIDNVESSASQQLASGQTAYQTNKPHKYIGTTIDEFMYQSSGSGNVSAWKLPSTQYFQGQMSNLTIYGKALTQEEITEIYRGELEWGCLVPESEYSLLCQTCRGNRILDENKKCIPPNNHYEDNVSENTPQCNSMCNGCIGDALNCIECVQNTRDVNNNCECINGYTSSQTKTDPCYQTEFACLVMKNSSECNQCRGNRILSNQGQCESKDGYYDDGVSQNLQKCSSSCKTCVQQANKCTSCISKQYLDDNNTCKQCHIKCQQCTSQNQCTECNTSQQNRKTDTTQNCDCVDGYYEDSNQICQKCQSGCQKCSSDTVCTQCVESNFKPENNCQEQSQQEQTINLSFSMSTEDKLLQLQNNNISEYCNEQCTSCQNTLDYCITCYITKNSLNNPPNCDCKDGYYRKYSKCLKCHPSCQTCSDDFKCLTCNEEMKEILNETTGLCTCQNGFAYNNNKQGKKECQACFQYKNSCLIDCPVHTYKNMKYMLCEDQQMLIQSEQSLIYIGGFSIVAIMLLLIICQIVIYNKKSQLIQWQILKYKEQQDKESQSNNNKS